MCPVIGTPRRTSLLRFVAGLSLVAGLIVASPAAQPVFRGDEIENMILITDAGYENRSRFVPIGVADIEKAMTRHGLSDAVGDARGSRH